MGRDKGVSRGKEKVVGTGFGLGLGHLGHDINFGVATMPWGS